MPRQATTKTRWSWDEMGCKKLPKTEMRFLRGVNLLPDRSDCGEPICTFDLCYFLSMGFNTEDARRKNILFIPGGPGDIVDRKQRVLQALEARYNIVYFDVRGCGLSKIPPSNLYDGFLRAKYVIEDVEKLRRKVLGNDQPWDAIYAHSFGTVIAQQYAHKYGFGRVKKLILSAPVVRQKETRHNRRNGTVSNFRSIYRNYRDIPCKKQGPEAMKVIQNVLAKDLDAMSLEYTNDFCFVNRQRIGAMSDKLSKLMAELERKYASMSFVVENYKELVRRDKDFAKYSYPKEFFIALRSLQFLGSPPVRALQPEDPIKQEQVNAALLLGYYLALKPGELNPCGNREVPFKESSPFMNGVLDEGRNHFRRRLRLARAALLIPRTDMSRRAYYVFGVCDGISRWIFGILKRRLDRQDCFTGMDIRNFADSRGGKNIIARKLAKRIGIDLTEETRPWDPKHYSHNVSTLVIHGGADPITAGGQAEYFFKFGLKNKNQSVLVKLPGMGHFLNSMPVAILNRRKIGWQQTVRVMVEKFLNTSSASAFNSDARVNQTVKALRGYMKIVMR